MVLPNMGRDVSTLAVLQPGTTPSGMTAGSFSDQNVFMLDGGNNSDDMAGNNTSYVFGSDANGDTQGSNDLIYIPRSTSEMNFATFTTTATQTPANTTFTAAQQAAAFEAYIQQDDYLRTHRGQYTERGAVFYPWVNRVDLSITQDLFHSIGGHRHGGQIRLDITNFGNLLRGTEKVHIG